MQTLTQEMNFSESTFILPAETRRTDVRMRIFTPAQELPMAGHPTIGSTFALAHDGVIAAGRDRFVFGLGVGPTPVALEWRGRSCASRGWTSCGRTSARRRRRPTTVARGGCGSRRVRCRPAARSRRFPAACRSSSCRCATRAAVDAAEPDGAAMRRLRSAFSGGHIGVFVFSTEPVGDGVTGLQPHVRAGPRRGEDPATGSASGPLGCYLVKHGLVPTCHRAEHMVSLQGVKMGRPSRLHIASTATPGRVTRVQVGGQAVYVGDGQITW